MALTPSERALWEKRLGWKAYLWLLACTAVPGLVITPLAFYLQVASTPQARDWHVANTIDYGLYGLLLGVIVATVMYLAARLYLWMGFLPPPR